ncbi:MAG TPA: HprK-related kinase A [Thiobacillaceae bacterium]|nr:HprK-related kinase A [Thiobacillaceae bacterium]
MRVADLGRETLGERLRAGLILETGPFRTRIVSRAPEVLAGLALLYGDFPVHTDGFADFHVQVDRVAGARRYFRPQVSFRFDGSEPFKPLPADHAFASLEWGLNWCIAGQAHHYLMLHAAVLEKNGRAVILPGDPGAGKSTLTAALSLSGFRLLSDELTLIDRDDGLLVPLARPVSLKNASIDVIRGFDPQAVLGDAAYDTHKGTVAHLKPSAESVLRMGEKAHPAFIVFPRWKAGAEARLTPHSKADAFMHAANHAFNYDLLGRLGYELNAGLIDACACHDFEYSRLADAVDVFTELLR